MDTNRLETSKIRPDVREITAADGFRADIVCGGSPCQDLARGGKQAGLDGDRSSLVFDLIRIGLETNVTTPLFKLTSRSGCTLEIILMYPRHPRLQDFSNKPFQ